MSDTLAAKDGAAIEDALVHWLRRLGRRYSLAGISLVCLDRNDEHDNIYSWYPERKRILDTRREGLPLAYAHLREGALLVVPDVRSLPEDGATDRATVQAADLRALLVIPFTLSDDRFGIIALKRRRPNPWPQSLVDELTVLGRTMVAALSRLMLEDRWRSAEERLAVTRSAVQSDDALIHLQRVATISDLSSAIAHELSQPLAAILANAQAARRLLQRGEPDLRALGDMVNDIAKTDLRAVELLRRIHGFLRKGDFAWIMIDLNRLVRDVLGLASERARLGGVELRLKLDPSVPHVRGDRIQLQQVLLNLLINAIDSMRQMPTRVLTIRTAPRSGSAVLSVSDTGTGISSAHAHDVFKPFFTTKEHGMGMGLSIAQTIVHAHGGRLRASNNRTGGATLSIAFPAAPS